MCITVWNIRKSKEVEKMEINCCKNHVEHALDMFVAQAETYPILTELSEKEKLSTKCDYCEETATYLVANA
ncbi:CxxH/CxxC protein [Planococcus beijingensis]